MRTTAEMLAGDNFARGEDMEVLCDECQATIQIPDERVPFKTTFRVKCPRCQRKIVANSKSDREEVKIIGTPLSADLPSKAPHSEGATSEEFLCETTERPHPGHHICLLCLDQKKGLAFLKSLLEGIGYTVDCLPSPDHALQRLRFNQYSIIILDDSFGAQVPNPVANYLMKLNMNARRDTFVILLGERFKTADQWQAFVESVNLVCHPVDLRQLPSIFRRALNEHERFYKVFNECLITAGKKI